MTKVLLNILFVIKKPYLFYPNTKFMTLVFCKLSNDFRIGFFSILSMTAKPNYFKYVCTC